eukprot:6208839-Prorocentrum_lima.AAC.1
MDRMSAFLLMPGLDAVWAGVPLITMPGATPAQRAGLSFADAVSFGQKKFLRDVELVTSAEATV